MLAFDDPVTSFQKTLSEKGAAPPCPLLLNATPIEKWLEPWTLDVEHIADYLVDVLMGRAHPLKDLASIPPPPVQKSQIKIGTRFARVMWETPHAYAQMLHRAAKDDERWGPTAQKLMSQGLPHAHPRWSWAWVWGLHPSRRTDIWALEDKRRTSLAWKDGDGLSPWEALVHHHLWNLSDAEHLKERLGLDHPVFNGGRQAPLLVNNIEAYQWWMGQQRQMLQNSLPFQESRDPWALRSRRRL